MIREPKNDTMPQDKYDLADFQALVLKYGPNYFNPKNNSPLQYFQVLVYSQQFERVCAEVFRGIRPVTHILAETNNLDCI